MGCGSWSRSAGPLPASPPSTHPSPCSQVIFCRWGLTVLSPGLRSSHDSHAAASLLSGSQPLGHRRLQLSESAQLCGAPPHIHLDSFSAGKALPAWPPPPLSNWSEPCNSMILRSSCSKMRRKRWKGCEIRGDKDAIYFKGDPPGRPAGKLMSPFKLSHRYFRGS